MHEHKTQYCDHDLQLCTDCDAVYCDMCQREWGKKIVYKQRIVESRHRYPSSPWRYTPGWQWTQPAGSPKVPFATRISTPTTCTHG